MASSATAPQHEGCAKITLRSEGTRGHANHGWLNSAHTFSFANWHDSRYMGLHSLRVINEDRVTGGEGFGSHPHREFEIFSYVVQGKLAHKDSLGHEEMLERGYVQFTSAGTGLSHSEYNGSPAGGPLVHFIQMWVKPNTANLKPSYTTRKFRDKEKLNTLRAIVTKDARNGSIRIHQDIDVYASILEPGKSITFQVRPGRDVYLHLIQDVSGFATEHGETALLASAADGQKTKLLGGDGVTVSHSNVGKEAAPQWFTIAGAGSNGANAEFILRQRRRSGTDMS
ncbi:pirin domain-containing protein [Geranomyces variabilis]|nr:pirin domain-containing protein [Geranomyces variabilis]